MKITICSSVDFTPKIIEAKKVLESRGHLVSIPYFSEKIMKGEINFDEYLMRKEIGNGDILLRQNEEVDMIERYWNLIKNSDSILLLNLEKMGIKGYIGGSTLMEMGFAYGHKKKIFLFNLIPEKSERMQYIDEIIDMDPIVINGDLNKI